MIDVSTDLRPQVPIMTTGSVTPWLGIIALCALLFPGDAVEAQTSLADVGGGCAEAACPDAPTGTVVAGDKHGYITMTWTPAGTGGTVAKWEVLYAETGQTVGGTFVEASRRKQVYASLDVTKTYDVQVRGIGSNGEVGDSAKATGIAPLNDPATAPPLLTLAVYFSAPLDEAVSGQEFTLEAYASGGSGGYSYRWTSDYWDDDQVGDTVDVVLEATTAFTVTVTDSGGRTASASHTVTVRQPPREPSPPAPPGPPQNPSPGAGPPPGNGGGPPPEPETDPEPPAPSAPPNAIFTVDAPCSDGLCRVRTGEEIAFTDTSSGTVARRSWDFFVPAGRLPSGAVVRHTWSSPGFYEVTLTVNGAGAESTASRVFLVEAANPAGTCEPDGETMCLQDSRYQVRATWQSPDGEKQPARAAHAGTNDSGLLWFHDAENWEALIKVLDGCAINGADWVFAASATTLGLEVEVTDTVTGEVRQYMNEPGRRADAVTDVSAFTDRCATGGRL